MKNILLVIAIVILFFVLAFLCAAIVTFTGAAQTYAILLTIIVTIIWILLIQYVGKNIKK